VSYELAKANALRFYRLPDILQLRFVPWDKHHQGTIKSWVQENETWQLRDYVKSSEVRQYLEKGSLQLKAYLVIIIGSRHILLWGMDKEGGLDAEPCLAMVPDRSDRYYS
jgi:hypothetical protein